MRSTIRVVLAYALVSLAWAFCSEWAIPGSCASGFPSPCHFKGCAYVFLTSGLLLVLLQQEAARHDQIEQGLRELAIYDPLTRLLNRACFMENLESALACAARDGTTVGVAFIDLDGFEEVNDAHGHFVGDELLIGVADRIKGVVRAADRAARLGGDEFVVLIHGERTGGTRRMAERLVAAIREPFAINGITINASASIGYALYPDHGQQAEELLQAADRAMYRVKQTGKDSFWGAEMKPHEEPMPC